MNFKALGKTILVFGIAFLIAGGLYVGLVAAIGTYYTGMLVDVMITISFAKYFLIYNVKRIYNDFKNPPYN